MDIDSDNNTLELALSFTSQTTVPDSVTSSDIGDTALPDTVPDTVPEAGTQETIPLTQPRKSPKGKRKRNQDDDSEGEGDSEDEGDEKAKVSEELVGAQPSPRYIHSIFTPVRTLPVSYFLVP